MEISTRRAGRRALAMASLVLSLAAAGCGEKMNEAETRGGTRVDDVAPSTSQPAIGASDDVRDIKQQTGGKGDPKSDASTPYGGSGTGVAPPVTPARNSQASGDSNSGQNSGSKEGPGADAGTDGAKPAPGASGPGTGTPPK